MRILDFDLARANQWLDGRWPPSCDRTKSGSWLGESTDDESTFIPCGTPLEVPASSQAPLASAGSAWDDTWPSKVDLYACVAREGLGVASCSAVALVSASSGEACDVLGSAVVLASASAGEAAPASASESLGSAVSSVQAILQVRFSMRAALN